MDLSNKSLALLLVAAIVISFAGTLISLDRLDKGVTGLATSGTGIVNFTVTEYAACAVDTNVSFGASGAPSAESTISTDTTNVQNGLTFNDCSTGLTCSGLTINNTGNTNLSIQYNSSVNATGFIGSQTGLDYTDFLYYTRNGTYTGAATGCAIIGNQTGNVTNEGWINLCNRLNPAAFNSGATAQTMEFNITLEPDVTQGEKTSTITFNCGQLSD